MDAFHAVEINHQTKKPSLFENESIVLLVENISIYDGDNLTNYQKGAISISSVRIIWYSGNVAIGLLHDSIVSVDCVNAGFLSMGSSPKISVLCRNSKHIKLSFHSGTSKRDEFYRLYKQLLFERQEYQRQQQLLQQQQQQQQQQNKLSHPSLANNPTNKPPAHFDTSNAGISGLIKQMNQRQEATDKALSEAFVDLGALMDKAKEMVNLSAQLKTTIDRQQSSSNNNNNSDEDELRQFLVQMGIAAPVTKKTAKSHYHTELSKQLSEWLIGNRILTSKGAGVGHLSSGMITLADLYCLFNRARGMDLISPDDLYRACLLFEQMDLPLRLRKFDSGVMVIQSIDESDEQVANEILTLIKSKECRGSITAFHLAKLQQISINLAKEKLLACEKLEKLCRDETIEGISFQENIFV